jgi:hypothetical protein
MNAYKFEKTIPKNGILEIPELKYLANEDVTIFIVKKNNRPKKLNEQKFSFDEFSRKWRGFLKGAKINNWEVQYREFLEEKYR